MDHEQEKIAHEEEVRGIHAEGHEAIPEGVRAPREKKDRILPISILIAAVMISGAVIFATMYKGGGTPSANTGTNATTTTQGTNSQVMTLGPRDAILGDANAPVTIVEYGDYQCPFCTQFFSQTEPQVIQNYVNTGKARMVFRNFAFLGPESTAAAAAADCAEDQNKLWAYHDALYGAKVADEARGGSENDGLFSQAELLKLGQQVGLDMPTFTSCVTSGKYTNAIQQEDQTAAGFGVNSTPTFFINGQEIQGAQPYSVFQQAITSAASS